MSKRKSIYVKSCHIAFASTTSSESWRNTIELRRLSLVLSGGMINKVNISCLTDIGFELNGGPL